MNAIYQVKADELDQSFLDAVKAAFKGKEIEIAVYERDEIAYLLRSPANREHLLEAIADVDKSQKIVTPEFLEKLADRIDLEDARSALADVEKKGTISWKKIKADLGL